MLKSKVRQFDEGFAFGTLFGILLLEGLLMLFVG